MLARPRYIYTGEADPPSGVSGFGCSGPPVGIEYIVLTLYTAYTYTAWSMAYDGSLKAIGA